MLSLPEAAPPSPHAARADGTRAADRGHQPQINALVSELYSLTEVEIAIVEGVQSNRKTEREAKSWWSLFLRASCCRC